MMQPNEKGTQKDLVLYRIVLPICFDLRLQPKAAPAETPMAPSTVISFSINISNNRAYYGIYHAISAVHALDGNAYKRHKDALANFNKNYVKTEIFPRKLGKKIVESEEIRHASDYDDFYIATREEAEEQIQTAKELVSRVEEYVQARWKKESEKTVRNAEYLDMIDRGIAQLSAGNGQEHELNETDCGCLTT